MPTEREVLLLVRDVTHETELEEQLAISERMASVGSLAAGVAHEINNRFSYVSLNLDVVLGDLARLEAGEDVDIASVRHRR